MTIPGSNRPFLIALIVALLVHSLLLLQLNYVQKDPLPIKKKHKPLIIEFVGVPQKKPQPPPVEPDRLAEINNKARVAIKSKEKQQATIKLPQPLNYQKISKQLKKQRKQQPASTQAKRPQVQKGKKPSPVSRDKKQVAKKLVKPTPATLKIDSALTHLAKRGEKNQESQGENIHEATVDLSTKQFKYAHYFGIIRRLIKMSWIYPLQAQLNKMAGTIKLSFSIDRHGKLLDIVVLRSSGRKILDQAAIHALRKASPFPALPDDWQLERLNIKVNFEYILNI
ncbi:MAG: energy transducer TonB [Magnetococcales bacterium]|nr:energy transducer TonB [Magnetococcales bacterium]